MILTEKHKAKIEAFAAEVEDGDLENALHFVGSDLTKMEIDDVLKAVLDESTYKRVVAVFQLMALDEEGLRDDDDANEVEEESK